MAKVVDVKFALTNFPTDAQEEENSLHDGRNEEHDPARPVGAGPDHNADCHDETTRGLDHHHGNAECTDELQSIGVRNLRGVLQSRENSGRDTKESGPEAKLFLSRA